MRSKMGVAACVLATLAAGCGGDGGAGEAGTVRPLIGPTGSASPDVGGIGPASDPTDTPTDAPSEEASAVGDDYLVLWEGEGFTLDGIKCDDPLGEWNIVAGGSSSDASGFSAAFTGAITIDMNVAPLTPDGAYGGTYEVDVAVEGANLPPEVTAALAVTGSGNVELRHEGESGARLVFLDGALGGVASGSAGDVAVTIPLETTEAGESAIDVVYPTNACLN